MTTKIFTVDDKRYEVAMASAVKQNELLGLVAQRLFIASDIAKKGGATLNETSVMITLMTSKTEEKTKIEKILLEQAVEVGTSNLISIKDFEGKMVAWNTLIAQVLIWNLSDFFALLANAKLEEMMKA